MKIGVVINPCAGNKKTREDILRGFLAFFSSCDFYCIDTCFEQIKRVIPNVSPVHTNDFYRDKNESFQSGLFLDFVDLFTVFGGDGTISDVIFGQQEAKKKIPLFGIGIGSANAGPFINVIEPCDFSTYDINNLISEDVDSIDVFGEGDSFIRSSFIDVVFSDCNISTVDGKITTVCSESFLEKKYVEKTPESIWNENILMTVNKEIVRTQFNAAQIIASVIRNKDRFSKMAVFGLISWLPYADKNAVLTISDRTIIKMTDQEDYKASDGMTLRQLMFGKGDIVEINNCKGYVIIDGNPLKKMGEGKGVCLKYNCASAKRIVSLDYSLRNLKR